MKPILANLKKAISGAYNHIRNVFYKGLVSVPGFQATSGRIYKWYLRLFCLCVPLSAMAAAQAGSLKDGLSLVLGIIFMIAFPWGVIVIWQGAQMKKKGDPDAHNSIIAGIWIAGAAVIMGAIYAAFSLGDAGSAPAFDFE